MEPCSKAAGPAHGLLPGSKRVSRVAARPEPRGTLKASRRTASKPVGHGIPRRISSMLRAERCRGFDTEWQPGAQPLAVGIEHRSWSAQSITPYACDHGTGYCVKDVDRTYPTNAHRFLHGIASKQSTR